MEAKVSKNVKSWCHTIEEDGKIRKTCYEKCEECEEKMDSIFGIFKVTKCRNQIKVFPQSEVNR